MDLIIAPRFYNRKMNVDQLKEAIDTLRAGGVILYPTDTIWGIGCDATNSEAVRRIFDIKRRPQDKSIIILLDDASKISRYVEDIPDIAWDLIECASRPLTVIFEKAKNLPTNVVNSDGSIAIRITGEEISAALCRLMGRPIVSTSANISGEPSAKSFYDISDEIKSAVDYIVPLRQSDSTETTPSQIIKLYNDGRFNIIRQ